MIIIHSFVAGPYTYRLDREGTSRLPMDGQVVMGESRELRLRNWSSLNSLQFHWPKVSDSKVQLGFTVSKVILVVHDTLFIMIFYEFTMVLYHFGPFQT